MRYWVLASLFLLAAGLALAVASGGGGGYVPTPTPVPTVAPTPQPTATALPSVTTAPRGGIPQPASGGAPDEPSVSPAPGDYACSGLGSVEERVRCRINLPEKNEHLQFLPEECRGLGASAQKSCYDTYDSIQKCRFNDTDDARVSCVKSTLGVPADIRAAMNACKDQDPTQVGPCVSGLRSRVLDAVKFRLYNFEERAEHFKDAHADAVVKFIADLERAKEAFNAAPAIAGKKQVLLGVNQLWMEFKQTVGAP